ncbi:MAG: chromosome segregation protein SMC [Acidobacteriota bacterium]|nr:MAG: chromosome segregation protein SMC [Acidobacteriota bacterium]
MKLERVDISGFKSFGEKAELTFHKGVTAVVGPNGCGKSNIADAIGWVLGEQSAKSLRGQKMEDLIFNGSESRPPLSLAEVNLRVSNVIVPGRSQNGDKSNAAKGEVLVTRRLNRSGDSEYLLDGVPSRLRDVQELFMGTGVGSKAYAIIEQGKIGLILSSKPTDRRIIIEEAAGITKYKSRRRSAELKLSAAQQNLFRVNDIVYEITRQMNSLKRQAGKARRYRRLRDAMDRLEKVFSVKRAEQQERTLRHVRARLQAVSDEELRRSTSLTMVEGFLERSRLRQAELEVELTDARESLHQLELTIERLDQTIEGDQQQLVELDSRRSQLETEMKELVARRGPVIEQLESRRREEAELAGELEGREEQTQKQQALLKEANLSLAELESRIEERRSEIVHRISKIAALHNFLQGVLANADKVSAELLKLSEEVRETESERGRVDGLVTAVRSELDKQNQNAETLLGERKALEEKAEGVRQRLEAIDERVSSDKDEFRAFTARLASLSELVAARAHFASGARLLLEKGNAHGVHTKGSIADAIEVEERFERAAEAFFDTALQRVRVESEDDVRSACDLLNADEEATRSELLVESLSTSSHVKPLDLPKLPTLRDTLERLRSDGISGLIGLLGDHIRWTSEPLTSALPNAIVVDNLEIALRCYRDEQASYVTLDGEVVSPRGVVGLGPGGASEGLLQTRREIRELERTVSVKKERLETSTEERGSLQEELDSLGLRLEQVRDQQHALDKTLVGLEHRRLQLDEESERFRRKHDVLKSESSRAESEKSSLAAKRTEMETTLEAEEAQKNDAETNLEAMRGELVNRRTGVEELQVKAAGEASRLAALNERHEAIRVDVERLKEGVEELGTRLEARVSEQQGLTDRKASLRDEIAGAEDELKASVASRAAKETATRALGDSVNQLRGRVDVTENALKARRKELEDVRERRSAEEVVLAKEENDFRHLKEGFEASHDMTLGEAASILNPVELLRDDTETRDELEDLKEKIDAIGPVNPMADEEYRELETRHEFVTKQRQDLLDSIESTETAIGRIDRTSRQRFKEAFDAINQEFAVTFRQLFGGGSAGLRLVDEQDVLESGIDIIVQPPGKRLQNVLLLSGGEKAMTAIALLFAIFRYRPSPFCLLDEVDAPLDDANVGRFLTMVRELRDTTQFIVITHHRKTMEMADHLFGITMEEPGVSKLVSVDFGEPEPLATGAVAWSS